MIALPVETWATIGTLLSALVALYVAMRAEMRSMEHRLSGHIVRLDGRIDSLEHKLTERIDSLEHKLTDRIDAVENKLTERIDRLDDRVYALAAGLKPQVEAARGDVAPS